MLSKAFLRFFSVLLLSLAVIARGQESITPTPSPSKRSVHISFLPPPLDGTISLGVYDAKGKRVRTLYREADINEFNIGTDALTTTWDGKNDEGENVPAGKYSAHGFAVGDLGSKSVGFFFNDFVTNAESPRIRHLSRVRLQDNELHLDADLAGDERATLVCDPKQGVFVRKLPFEGTIHCDQEVPLPTVTRAIDCDFGTNGTLWLIDGLDSVTRREIKQLSK